MKWSRKAEGGSVPGFWLTAEACVAAEPVGPGGGKKHEMQKIRRADTGQKKKKEEWIVEAS
jgi:hypothetical protein